MVLDVANLLGGARHRRTVPDYGRIVDELAQGRPWTGVACLSRPANGKPIGGIIRMFAALGFRPSVWEPVWSNGQLKTDADPLVVQEAMSLVFNPRVGEICLAAGDSDYRYLARACRAVGKRFRMAAFRGTCHSVLATYADQIVDLDWQHTLPCGQFKVAA